MADPEHCLPQGRLLRESGDFAAAFVWRTLPQLDSSAPLMVGDSKSTSSSWQQDKDPFPHLVRLMCSPGTEILDIVPGAG